MNHAIIITQQELQALITSVAQAEVAKQIAKLEASRQLPERLSCVKAAQYLGVSKSTFFRNFKHLIRRDENGVYVAGKDVASSCL